MQSSLGHSQSALTEILVKNRCAKFGKAALASTVIRRSIQEDASHSTARSFQTHSRTRELVSHEQEKGPTGTFRLDPRKSLRQCGVHKRRVAFHVTCCQVERSNIDVSLILVSRLLKTRNSVSQPTVLNVGVSILTVLIC